MFGPSRYEYISLIYLKNSAISANNILKLCEMKSSLHPKLSIVAMNLFIVFIQVKNGTQEYTLFLNELLSINCSTTKKLLSLLAAPKSNKRGMLRGF